MDCVLQTRGVTKSYRQGAMSVPALHGVDVAIDHGEFVTLAGPSGCGKTTLLNLMGGLDRPDQGAIVLGEHALQSLSNSALADVRLNKLGFIFQDYNLISVLSARENVEFIMQLQRIDKRSRRRRAEEVLQQVGLGGLGERRPGELSGGQQQRVAVARAIASRPALVLADEPTANLDSQSSDQLMDLFRTLNEDDGITIVVASHDPRMIEFSKRRLRMLDGRIVADT